MAYFFENLFNYKTIKLNLFSFKMSSNELDGSLVRTHDDTRRFKFFRISTTERTNGEPYNFNVNFGNDFKLDSSIEIHLVSATIPNIANNVSIALANNTFSMNFTVAGLVTFQVDEGFYNITDLLTTLTASINSLIGPSTMAVTQDPLSSKIRFEITAGPDTFDYLSYASGNLMANVLGGLVDSFPLQTNYILETIPSLYGSTIFFIHSQELAPELTYLQANGSDVNSVNGMFTIPVTVPYGNMQTYYGTELDRVVFGRVGRSTRNFSLVIRTNHGRFYTELTDNQEAILTIKVLWSDRLG